MKKISLIFFCFISLTALAQKMPDEGYYKARITLPDMTILAEIDPIATNPTAKANLFYYWYEANAIHSTQGGFSGKLLNGQYNEYYPNKNLKVQGGFKKGLKNGEWKSWNVDGTLTEVTTWKNGVQVLGEKVPLWKKLNIFRKRQGQETDTLKKPGKQP
jgi:antitoxin component YwqK of YwqJK toxin-antitoxin module